MTEIAIYSDIDSQTGFGPDTLRKELTKAAGEPVTIRLNSEGGNVIDGLACYNLLRSYAGETTVVIDGMALSIASLVVCGADSVKMAENAWMMVHNPHNQVAGDGDDLRDMAGLLDGMRDQLAAVYTAKSKKSKEEILQLMEAETWMTGPQALEAGFVDEVTASLEVAAEFDASRFSKPPKIQKMKELIMPDAATFQELKTAFPKAQASFIVACQEKSYTLEKARAEFDEESARELFEKTVELDTLKAEFDQFKKEMQMDKDEKKEAEEKAKAEADEDVEEEEKIAEAKAKSGVAVAISGRAKGIQGSGSRFMDGVNEQIKRGISKSKAVSEMVHADPEGHREFVLANQPRGSVR